MYPSNAFTVLYLILASEFQFCWCLFVSHFPMCDVLIAQISHIIHSQSDIDVYLCVCFKAVYDGKSYLSLGLA